MPHILLNKFPIELDREAAYGLLLVISGLHGRTCKDIADCADMGDATSLAQGLTDMCHAYNEVEKQAAKIDDREPSLLTISGYA